jgi:hypothetical protein
MVPKNERGSIPSSVHAWRGWTYVSLDLKIRRDFALSKGWIQSKAKNKWLLWIDRIGRLQWFGTGRVNIYVRKPATRARVYQLISNAFFNSELIDSVRILELVLRDVKFKGAHYVFETGERLPKMDISFFDSSNGVTVKVGDRSHPSSIEVLAYQPDWGERTERLLTEYLSALRESKSHEETAPPKRMWYVG